MDYALSGLLNHSDGALLYLRNYLKLAPPLPQYSLPRRLATLHLAEFKHRFYDTTLNVNVDYAKHAISIDENRKDFARVGWSPSAAKKTSGMPTATFILNKSGFPVSMPTWRRV